jgi:hypothetical protein
MAPQNSWMCTLVFISYKNKFLMCTFSYNFDFIAHVMSLIKLLRWGSETAVDRPILSSNMILILPSNMILTSSRQAPIIHDTNSLMCPYETSYLYQSNSSFSFKFVCTTEKHIHIQGWQQAREGTVILYWRTNVKHDTKNNFQLHACHIKINQSNFLKKRIRTAKVPLTKEK